MDFSRTLLNWHDHNARDLPWRGERDPYRIWVSEVMLQQTQTGTVAPFYARFLSAFPTVYALADAPWESVAKMWEGLGYYSRARNLHRAAHTVAYALGGRLPETVEGLKALPGVGEYTAAAIASIAFGVPALAVDGNVRRSLARILGIRLMIDSRAALAALRAGGEPLVPADRPGDFNQALMGLGNMICTPTRPNCPACPVRAHCIAHAEGIEGTLPVMPARPEKRIERRAVALAFWGARVLVVRRPDAGLLGGLWEFPNFEGAEDAGAVCECLDELGAPARFVRALPDARHVFTHLVWQMRGYQLALRSDVAAREGMLLADRDMLSALAMPAAMQSYRQIASDTLSGEEIDP